MKRVPKNLAIWWSCLLLGMIVSAYFLRPPEVAAITVWPIWTWAVLGIVPLVFKFSRVRALVVLLWVLAWIAFSDESASFARQLVRPQPHDLRVVTLNCAGSLDAAKETIALGPDIILLQESMGTADLEQLRQALGNGWRMAVGVDASILAKGELREVVASTPKPTNYTMVWAGETLIVSLRLSPPVLRFDYWNPACWRAYADAKVRRRRELSDIVGSVAQEANGAPVIVGGDFNTPPDHWTTEQLSYMADDSFARAGRGYGATAVSGFPLVRIDQVWASPDYVPLNSFAVTTEFSDHRIAVADFKAKRKFGE